MLVTGFMQQVARHTHVDRSATSVRKVKKEDGLQIKGTSLPLQSLLRIWKNGDVGHVGEVSRHILALLVPLERLMHT